MKPTLIHAAAIGAFAAVIAAGCGLTVKSDVNHALIGTVHCGSYAWAGSFSGTSALRGTITNPLNEERLRTSHRHPPRRRGGCSR
jgi:hypothetical protein